MQHKIGIIGAGFVGTACEIGFSSMPNTSVHIYDKFKPTDSLRTVVSRSHILFVCLPTPMREDGSCDTSIVADGVRQIAKNASSPKCVVIKSTVPPGTVDALQREHPNHFLFFNPEFLTEKHFIDDFANQKTIYLGAPEGKSSRAKATLELFYKAFTATQKTPAVIVWTSAKTAEMLKYTCNSFLAAKVSFFNEIYQICQATDVEYSQLANLLATDERIGRTHLATPGPDGQFGFGGSCFPKDLNALMALAREHGVDPMILEAAWAKNLVVRENCEWENLPQVNGRYHIKAL